MDPAHSSVATGGARGQSATPDSKKFAKNWRKSGKIGKKEEKSGTVKTQKSGRFFQLAPPDR